MLIVNLCTLLLYFLLCWQSLLQQVLAGYSDKVDKTIIYCIT